MSLRLEQSWTPGDGHGAFHLTLVNAGGEDLPAARLCYSSQTRLAEGARTDGGRLVRTFANHVEIDLAAPLPAGGTLQVVCDGLTHPPKNRTQGVMAAWLELPGGGVRVLEVGDLVPPEGTPRGPVTDWPEGRIDVPLGLMPWPARVEVDGFGSPPLLIPLHAAAAPGAAVAALHRRLFPAAPAPFALAGPGTEVVAEADPALSAEGYRLAFSPDRITLAHPDEAGLRHGLIALAQMTHAARTDDRFAFPQSGTIADAPRFGWRGCHFDVARNFHGAGTVLRLIDILAWLRMNRLHWHLTDDEGWRLPSRAFQGLADLAGTRARGTETPPQYADGPEGQSGSYTEAEVAQIRDHAAALGITVMPELDIPGHVTALLHAIPGLTDPDEPAGSYHSIQGYPNNALNPALPRTYEVVETLLREAAELFPGAPLHVGSDEVDHHSWQASPAALALAAREGLSGAAELQAHFLRKVQGMVRDLGRGMGAWDEAADGGGVDPDGTLLFAWRSKEKTAELIAAGYDVVATPGQAYYLDMATGAGWDAPGATWAGIVPPEAAYAYDPAEGLPDGPGRLVGVQACIWTEHLNSVARLNEMVFPRLALIAEAAWTPADARDWPRAAALSRLVPTL
ncbi:beta-N-acetylhexosaminidase [Wenxinia marina]|uniref:beta-N-acetylhexosaminidase n=1 Tax=Wenxinia marina TaxID=390641 RepID=UPI00037E69D6|nr:family 20 glycosylhydrolase [Wenxinia marina]GGL61717.1 beta-N-acetylhexosaminidase [Wenxinia marina]